MSTFVFSNNCSTTLADAITSTSATTMTLASTANFPTIPGGDYWVVFLNDAATRAVFEVVYVTSIAGAVCTIMRGQEGTTAQTWLVGDYAYGAVSAGELAAFVQGGGNFVELSPGSAQSGFVDVVATSGSGETSTILGAQASTYGVIIGNQNGGPSVRFDANGVPGIADIDVNGVYHVAGASYGSTAITSLAYGNTSFANLAFRALGNTGYIGIGPSSGIVAQGITASALAIGLAGSSSGIAIDTSGNIATTGNVYGTDGVFSTGLTAPDIIQNGTQVISAVTSTGGTLLINQSGAGVDIEAPIVVCNARLRWNQTTGSSTPLSGGNSFANYPSLLGGCSSPMWGATTGGSIQISFGLQVKSGAGAQTISGTMVSWSDGSGYVFLNGALLASEINVGPSPVTWTGSVADDGAVHQLVFLVSVGSSSQINGITVGSFLPTNAIGGLDTTKFSLVEAGT